MATKYIGNNAYSYRSIRQGDRVVTIYLGTGPPGRSFAERLAEEREQVRAERRADEQQTRPLREWSRRVDEIVRDALTLAGYHRHDRGEWRRRRVVGDGIKTTKRGRTPTPMTPEVAAVEKRWREGDRSLTSDEAHALILARPTIAKAVGSPAGTLLIALLMNYVGTKDKVRYEATLTKFAQVEADLAGEQPTAMEALLAERAALCWLELNFMQTYEHLGKDKRTIAQATYHQKRIDGAHRRFLAAVRTLAQVRKLALPDFHFNIDQRTQSVHVTSPTVETASGPTIHIPQE